MCLSLVAREHDLVGVGVGDGALAEDMHVDELLHLLGIGPEAPQGAARVVVGVPQDAERQVVDAYAITPGAHRFLAGVADYEVEFIGNSHFHRFKTANRVMQK